MSVDRNLNFCLLNSHYLCFSLQESEYNQLVGNLEELIEAHQRLNSSLEDVRRGQPRQQRVGQIFLQHGNSIRYCTYCMTTADRALKSYLYDVRRGDPYSFDTDPDTAF
jgi:hypothetical protein